MLGGLILEKREFFSLLNETVDKDEWSHSAPDGEKGGDAKRKCRALKNYMALRS